jgi:acyl-homoserine lactone acylase PvdQ
LAEIRIGSFSPAEDYCAFPMAIRRLALIVCFLSAAAAPAAHAQLPIPLPGGGGPPPGAYQENDFGGFRNVLPPGENGLGNAADLAAFMGGGARPPHSDDQLPLYRDLLSAYPGLDDTKLDTYFKDASFGVKPEDVERTYSPRDDVTIVRDNYGVPHIYGATRAGAEFGIGYATAEDRLFFLDVFRHLGRAQLSSFVGGAPANRELDEQVWNVAAYTEADLQKQVDARPPEYAAEADVLRNDLENYVAGINKYIAEARLDPQKMPAEYAAIGRPQGPDDWKPTDVTATAAVVGSIFGAGGGRELPSALVLQRAIRRFGRGRGRRVWRDFRSAEDPEAPTTVRKRFPYQKPPRKPRGVALPDPGSITDLRTADPSTTKTQVTSRGMSNALLVSGRLTHSGRPIAVFGPQTAYFAPEILMEQDVHAPSLDVRGVAFPGTNLYVQLGRGRDYAWSATSAGQDITDTFAVPLCEADGSEPSITSDHYMFRGECLQIETLTRTNSWQPTPADQTPAGTETLTAERTKLGLVTARATIKGKPVVYTRLRTTYGHETDSGLGFSYFNDPDKVHDAASFQQAAGLIGYTFNWFYVDHEQIAYFNSGFNPVRAPRTDPNFPVHGRFEWPGWDADANVPRLQPLEGRPQAIDPTFLTSWNNKQAPGTRAADGNWGYGPTYRSKTLDDRVRGATAGGKKIGRVELVQAMEDAATVDLRGDAVLPWVLKAAGKPHNPRLKGALDKLRAWQRSGAHRIDRDGDGAYEDAEAIQLMDAWWPLLVRAQFEPALGHRLFEQIVGMNELSNDPNNHGQHLGSAWQHGWYGYVIKDLRTLLGKRVRGRYSRVYCGARKRGPAKLRRCRYALIASLKQALAVDPAKMYDDAVCNAAGKPGDQACFDSIYFRPLGAITQPLIPWQNRPTFQQVVEVQGGR